MFESSEHEPLLQVADVMAYVLRRRLADQSAGRTSKPEIERWADQFVVPHLVPVPPTEPGDEERHRLMVAEHVVMNAGGPLEVRQRIAGAFTRFPFEVLERQA